MSSLPSFDTPIDLAALADAATAALADASDAVRQALVHHDTPTPEQLVKIATGKPSWAAIAKGLIHGPQAQPALFVLALARLAPSAQVRHDGDLEITEPTIIAGDLHVRGNLRIVSALWVTGSLTCDGLIRDCGPDSHITVGGDLRAVGLRASGEVFVRGSVGARVVQGAYNDNSLVVGGDLESEILFEDDHDISVYGERRARVDANLDMPHHEQLALVGAALAPGFISEDDGLDIDALVAALVRGEPAIVPAVEPA